MGEDRKRPQEMATQDLKALVLALAASVAILATSPYAKAQAPAVGLTATITQVKPVGDNNFDILVVVDNPTNERFEWTSWSCLFFSNNTLVGEETVIVEINEPGKQSAKTWHVKTFKPFDKSECRLTRARK